MFRWQSEQTCEVSDSNQTGEEDEFDTPAFDKTDFGEGWKV
jgi:hypothetical protein|tara:strand:+ start:51 stop:173 length:123 start_codon:yes stop_codon:yes gene_type:complete